MGGKGKGKGWGGGPGFGGPGFGHHHHHHRHGLGPGLLVAEAAVAGAVIATAARPRHHHRPPLRHAEVIVVNAGRPGSGPVVVVPARGGRRPAPRHRAQPVQVTVAAPARPLGISSITMPQSVSELRGHVRFFAVDVTPESGAPWRVMRCYNDFSTLHGKVGTSSQDAPFLRSLEETNSGDRRHDFGMAFPPHCVQCGSMSLNRGDSATRKVYCIPCFNLLFPDAAALQAHARGLETWLQRVLQHRNTTGPWTEPLRGFLEAGRTALAVQGVAVERAASPQTSGYAAATAPPVPMPAPDTPAPAQPEVDSGDSEQVLSIDIPAGVTAGQTLSITVADGKQVQFIVPAGRKSGDTLDLLYDAAAGTLVPLDDSGVQPTGATPAASEAMAVDIPAGVSAGQTLAISVPDGRQIQFTVPAGKKGGDQVNLWFDAAAGTLTVMDDVPNEAEGAAGSAEQVMSIEVPAGVAAGQVIAVTVPDGRQLQVTVPAGKKGGDQLDLWFDAEAGTLAPLS